MKVIPPTLRDNVRYVAFEVISDEIVKAAEIKNEILSATTSLLGDVGVTNLGIELISFAGQKGLLRCRNNRIEDVRSVLATVFRVKKFRLSVRVLGVSGTLAAAKEKYLLIEKKSRRETSFNIKRPISGKARKMNDSEIDIVPGDNKVIDRSDVGLVGIAIHDNKELK